MSFQGKPYMIYTSFGIILWTLHRVPLRKQNNQASSFSENTMGDWGGVGVTDKRFWENFSLEKGPAPNTPALNNPVNYARG